MKIKNFILSIIMAVSAVTAHAYDIEDNGIYYNVVSLDEMTLAVAGGNWVGDVVIPSSVIYNGRKFTATTVEGALAEIATEIDAMDLAVVSGDGEVITAVSEDLNWILVEGEKQKVRNWRGTRANYELLVQNSAVSPWTRYVVIDTINGKEVITEYYGQNQVAEATGQLLPVKDIIGSISDITPQPYDRYLVGSDGQGYKIYEYVIEGDFHKWLIKPFDYRYGVRVIERGLKNYVYVNNVLKTYDDVDCGSF